MTEAETLDFLRLLVETHSGPENVAGINRVQEILRARLETLGFACRRIPNPDPKILSGDLLVGTYAGADPRTVDFVTHADTLQAGAEERAPFQLDAQADVAVGPGVMDDKGGQVVALNGLEAYLRELGQGDPTRARPPFTLKFISSPSEEFGSPGFQGVLQELSRDSVLVLGFEPGLDDGSIIEARRGNRWYKIQVEGREAHSGRAHRMGVNAAHDLVQKLAEIQAFTDYSKDVTVNVGSMRAGRDAYNVVCGEAEAKLDTRFSSFEDREELHQRIHGVLSTIHVRSEQDGAPARTRYEIADDCPPFPPNPLTSPLVDGYRKIVGSIEGRAILSKRSGGAADCCYMSRPGLRIIDGLGPIGGKMHTIEEHVSLKSLATRAEALRQFLHAHLPGLG